MFIPLFLFIWFAAVQPAEASLLRLFAPSGSGAVDAFPDNSTENDFDLTRPALLLREKKRKIAYAYEYEDIYKLKQGDELKYRLYAYKNKFVFLYPQRFRDVDVVLGFDTYFSKQSVFANHEDIEGTSLVFDGSGYALSLAASYKNFSLGFYDAKSRSDGDGTSAQLINAVSVLSSDARVKMEIGEEKQGFQLGVKLPDMAWYYRRNTIKVPLRFRMSDAEDDFYFPIGSAGSSYELMVLSSIKRKMPVVFSYQEGSTRSLDTLYYNVNTQQGRHLQDSRYKIFAFGLKRNKLSFGLENYHGRLKGAAAIDTVGNFFGLIGGFYVIHYDADLRFNRYRFSYHTSFKKMPMVAGYSAMFFNLHAHYDSVQKFFFNLVEKNKTERNVNMEGQILHSISLGIKREVSKNVFLGYNLIQQLPPPKKKQADKVTDKLGGGTDEDKGKSSTTGGTLHIFTLQYDF